MLWCGNIPGANGCRRHVIVATPACDATGTTYLILKAIYKSHVLDLATADSPGPIGLERLMRCHRGGKAALPRLASASFYVGLAPAFFGALRHDLPAKKFSDRRRLYSGTFHPGFHVFRPSRSLPWMGIFVHDRRRDLKRSPACLSGPMSVVAASRTLRRGGEPDSTEPSLTSFPVQVECASESSVSGPIRGLTE